MSNTASLRRSIVTRVLHGTLRRMFGRETGSESAR
jgi:hypothetical protein